MVYATFMKNVFRTVREELGWTQQECADFIGIHRVRWAQLEGGARPSIDTAQNFITLAAEQCNKYLTLEDIFLRNGG